MIILFLTSSLSASAQNSSYNGNSIPITCTLCTAFGTNSLNSNNSGYYNVATGYNSLSSNTGGNSNTATGHQTLQTNTNGSFNRLERPV